VGSANQLHVCSNQLVTDFHVLEILSYVKVRLFVEGIPSKSTISLNFGDFKLAGEVMAMSIVQHGQAPNFLSPVIYAYFSGSTRHKISKPQEFCE